MTAATPTSAVLSAELAAPLAAGAPLIVPTGRIGTVLRAAWDRAQLAAGRQTWLAPPVLTWSEWLAQRVAVVPAALGTAELVLSPAQELALWRRIVADSLAGFGLRGRNPGPLARMAQRAWELQHAYGARLPVESARDTLEQRAYRQWAARFAELADTLGVTDAARVLTRLPPYRAASGDCARCSGFFAATPAQQAQLPSALESIAAAPHARVHCLQYPDVADEVAAVTAWALDARAAGGGHAAPAIVCADTALVPLVEAALDRAVARLSARNVAAAGLAAYRAASPAPPAPMLAAALGLLGEPREIPRGRAAALVASPYLGTAPTDAVGRARAVERLVGDDVRPLDLAALADTVRSVGGAGFGNCLDTMQALAAERQRRRDLKQWLARIEAALDQAGWPGPQPLLGHEEFALKRWRRACDDVAALDLVLPPQSLPEVLALLEQQLHSAGGERPLAVDAIEILTLEEAAAARPQPRWIVGLHAASWPASADISPFLPFALQRAAGMPGAHRERQYALATKIFAAAYGAAGCTASFSAHAANVAQQAVTGLPLDIQRASTLAPPPADQAVFAFVTDDQVPLAPGTAVRGGAAILTDQSACPFRAFAHHRLGARAGEEPLLGPDGRQRGDLVHRVLAAFWRRHRASRAVRALDAAARARAIDAAIEEALREAPPWPVGRGGEPARLRRLCLAWLPVDLEYGDFEVIACETARALTLADLPLELRIDRIDRRADGVVRLVDYKTGSDVRRRMWEPPRPEQPQLPLYVLAEPDAGGIAFAQVHPDKPRWVEFPDRREPEPARAFDLERAAWADALHTLARNFVAGAAAVDPLPNACRHCDLQTLCRIRERRGAADAESEDD